MIDKDSQEKIFVVTRARYGSISYDETTAVVRYSLDKLTNNNGIHVDMNTDVNKVKGGTRKNFTAKNYDDQSLSRNIGEDNNEQTPVVIMVCLMNIATAMTSILCWTQLKMSNRTLHSR